MMEFVQEEGVCGRRGSETANLFPVGDSRSVVEREREHMFDKVVTPSDVGKLNRLVIPKQHAEKYFPLEQSSNTKGLLLNFEDRHGKPWRFRYSYWNSSQSYVMTKGWSRFVKDKKLDAGDIVSFHRLNGGDRLFIDWRRRPQPPPSWPWGTLYHRPQPPVYYRPSLFPIMQHSTTVAAAGKRLRLFGVNMEQSCECDHHQINNTNHHTILHPSTPHQHHVSSSSDKGKSSLSFDFHL